ncbi:hypothetical protein L195_g059467, partial [Trifolium pratense]
MGAREISRFEMMDKTWRVVIRCLGGKKLMEIAMKWIYRFEALVEETQFDVEVHQSGMAMKILCGSNGDQA